MYVKYAFLALGLLLVSCGQQSKAPVDETDQIFALEGDLAAGHVLIAFKGATGADEKIERTEAEALEKAEKILGMLLAEPERFQTLAQSDSDGMSAQWGGNLGAWRRGDFLPEFEEAVEALMIGQIRDTPLRTEYGFHVIRRHDLNVKHYSAQGFFISFKGHPRNPPRVHRTREEAEALAMSLKDTVTAANFEEMARQHNDLGEGAQFMGIIRPGDPFPPEALKTLSSLSYGEVGGPVAFPMGYAFMRREKVVRYQGQGILLAYQGAKDATVTIGRNKQEALEEAKRLITQIQEAPDTFGDLARSHSNSPTAAKDGRWTMFRGEMEPAFRSAYETLSQDTFTEEPVDTPYGFYIIKRSSAE